MTDLEPKPKKKRKKGTSPTARTLAECKKHGWPAQVVEKYNSFVKRRFDLFGCIDVVAITPGGILGIQAAAGRRESGGGDIASHRTKILAEPRIKQWIEAGGRFELWSWSDQGKREGRKRWQLRIELFSAADFPVLTAGDDQERAA